MRRSIATAALLASLVARPLSADPRLSVDYPRGVPRLEIAGDFINSRYRVLRADAPVGDYRTVTNGEVLCIGSCFVEDYDAVPGRAYLYRFDLSLADGSTVSFGPYPVVISPTLARRLGLTITPNPSRGAASIEFFLAGRQGETTHTEVALFDLQGRKVARLHHGPLASGITRLGWDGNGTAGARLGAGVYLMRVATSDGRLATQRVLRLR